MSDQRFANNEELEVKQNAIAAWLDGVEFFSSFDVFSLERLILMVRKNTYKPPQEILSQGALADALHAIYAGEVNILIDGTLVTTLGPRNILGERSIFSLGEELTMCRSTVIPASSVVITYSWSRSSLLELFIKDDRIYGQFKKLLNIEEHTFREIRMFKDASVDFKDMLEANSKQCLFNPGEILFEEKKPNGEAYLLCEGEVAIVKDGDLQVQLQVSDVSEAILFGEFNVLGLWLCPKATVTWMIDLRLVSTISFLAWPVGVL